MTDYQEYLVRKGKKIRDRARKLQTKPRTIVPSPKSKLDAWLKARKQKQWEGKHLRNIIPLLIERASIEHLVPAIKHSETKKVVKGHVGQIHNDLLKNVIPNYVSHVDGPWQRGFFHTKEKKYLTRQQSGGLDSTDLMNPTQKKLAYQRAALHELIDPQFLHIIPKILTNPGPFAVAQEHAKTKYKQLRYVMDRISKKVHVGNAEKYTHRDIVGEKNVPNERNSLQGYINSHHIPEIKAHPRKLQGWIEDRHALHGRNFIADRSEILPSKFVGATSNNQKRKISRLHELFGYKSSIVTNPSKSRLSAQLAHSDTHQLRYLKHQKNVYTANSNEYLHDDLADHAGGVSTALLSPEDTKHSKHGIKLGMIDQKHKSEIKAHPKGLGGWIEDRHNKAGTDYL